MNLRKMRRQAERECLAWKHSVGVKVRVTRDNGAMLDTVTRSDPWVLGEAAVIMVGGISGGYLLSRVAPLAGP